MKYYHILNDKIDTFFNFLSKSKNRRYSLCKQIKNIPYLHLYFDINNTDTTISKNDNLHELIFKFFNIKYGMGDFYTVKSNEKQYYIYFPDIIVGLEDIKNIIKKINNLALKKNMIYHH